MDASETPERRGVWKWLFESPDLNSLAPATKVLVYGLLAIWSFIVLFPRYWVVITSLKLPVQVDDGPDYFPFIDFAPSLHAWRYILFDLGNDTLRPYINSLIIASCSTVIAVPLIAVAGARKMADAWRLGPLLARRLGDDILVVGDVLRNRR